MSIFQILATLFAIFMLYVVSIHYKKQTISAIESSFWYSTWGFFIVIALFPDLLLGITGALKFARVFDLLIVIAFMIVNVVLFLSYFQIKRLERKIEKFVREKAVSTLRASTKNK